MTSWQDISTAPKDGTRFRARKARVDHITGRRRDLKRITWWGKAAHVPLYGWAWGAGHVEDHDLWEPTHWKPDPPK